MFVMLVALFLQVGNPIVTPPELPSVQTSAPQNVTVNVTMVAPEPDPAAVNALYDPLVARTTHGFAEVPTTWANALLGGPNIWTRTPHEYTVDIDGARRVRGAARTVMLALLGAAIVWTGTSIAFGSVTGSQGHLMLLPILAAGFALAWYADDVLTVSVAAVNAVNEALGSSDLSTFSGRALDLPRVPEADDTTQLVTVPVGFLGSVLGSAVYAVILVLLEVQLVMRSAWLIVLGAVFPIASLLWAVPLTHAFGTTMLRMFFGMLIAQPLIVVALQLAGGLAGGWNGAPDIAQVLVRIGVLLVALQVLRMFGGANLGIGGLLGVGAVLLGARQVGRVIRTVRGGSAPPPPAPARAGRAWRPAFGSI